MTTNNKQEKIILKKSVFNTSVFDWNISENKAVSVDGFIFSLNGLKCGLYNVNIQSDILLKTDTKKKYVIIDLETGLQIFTAQFKKDILQNISLLSDWIEKAIKRKQELKNKYIETYKNNYIDYFKNLVKNI